MLVHVLLCVVLLWEVAGSVIRNDFYEDKLHPHYCDLEEVLIKPRFYSSEEMDDKVRGFGIFEMPASPSYHPWLSPLHTDVEDFGYIPEPEGLYLYMPDKVEILPVPIKDPVNRERSVITEESKTICNPELNENSKYHVMEVFVPKNHCSTKDAPAVKDVERIEKSELTEEARDMQIHELAEKEFLPTNTTISNEIPKNSTEPKKSRRKSKRKKVRSSTTPSTEIQEEEKVDTMQEVKIENRMGEEKVVPKND